MKNGYVNAPFFVGSCSSNPQPFQKSSGSPEVGACFFLGQMAHDQIYQIARNIIYCQQRVNIFVKTSSIFWISTSTTTTTTKMVYQIEVLQQRGPNLISGPYKSTIPGPLFFLRPKKTDPRNLVGPTSIPTKG